MFTRLVIIKDIMSKIFSLLSLNNVYWGKYPRSWICISGKNIKEVISKMEEEIIKQRKTNREQIGKLIAKSLNCNHVSVKRLLQGNTNFYPIPIIVTSSHR